MFLWRKIILILRIRSLWWKRPSHEYDACMCVDILLPYCTTHTHAYTHADTHTHTYTCVCMQTCPPPPHTHTHMHICTHSMPYLSVFSSPTDCVWGGGEREGEWGGERERGRERELVVYHKVWEFFFSFFSHFCFMWWALCSEGEMAQKRTHYYHYSYYYTHTHYASSCME